MEGLIVVYELIATALPIPPIAAEFKNCRRFKDEFIF
jgi:hypothetical protein